jgi:nitrate reductase (cytochrome), electron transfer subunit
MKLTLEKTMQKLIMVLLMLSALAVAHGQETSDTADEVEIDSASNGGQASLRGLIQLDVTKKADPFKRVPKDRSPYVSDYVYQPPLIPHRIRGYEISTNANKCLSCHSFKKARESGATKISVTHYGTREGQVLSDVSPRRYFCLQCHVTQADTALLIDNDFKRVDSLR